MSIGVVDANKLPDTFKSLVNNITIVDDLGCPDGTIGYGYYDRVSRNIEISKSGISSSGLLRTVAHELAHKYCHIQRDKRDNRFLREYALMCMEYGYYWARHLHRSTWFDNHGILESFAHSFSNYVTGVSEMPKTQRTYFSRWFPLEKGENNDN